MPGLIGIVDPQGVERDVLERMAVALKLEDRYSVNLYCDEIIGLGRVSLGKLNPEQQPIFNEDRSLCICMEGELYDYAELKQSLIESGHRFTVNNEPELVLHLYEEFGSSFPEKLNGAFVVAIWDFNKHRLVIVNDRMGLRPLYYAQNGPRLLFASLANVLLADPTLERGVNPVAVAELFSFEYLLGNKTLYEGVSLLPPASVLTYEGGQLRIEPHWDFQFNEEYDARSEEGYIRSWHYCMREAVRRQLKRDGAIGVHLSGGMDSRALVAIINELGHPVSTFTFGTPGCGDAWIAKRVARRLNVPNYFYELEPTYLVAKAERGVRLTDGTKNCVDMHVLGTLEETAEQVDVLYTGYMVDAFLNPLMDRRFVGIHSRDVLDRMVFESINTLVKEKDQRDFFSSGFYPHTVGVAFRSVVENLDQSTSLLSANKWAHFWVRGRQRRFTLHGTELLRDQIVCRTPFCDNALVDFMRSIPPVMRLDAHLYFRAFASTYRELAKIPYEKTGLPLVSCPEDVYVRAGRVLRWKLRSMGWKWVSDGRRKWYGDYDEWMRTALKDFVMTILLDQKTLERGYFDPNYIRALVKKHMDGDGNYSHPLGAILTFELWNRLFMDR
ncbi:MAG: asparagine synthase-related protein [Chloroflexota bacterium]|nr:asparagine synthase-related protein [Chloroflexota bacterium]